MKFSYLTSKSTTVGFVYFKIRAGVDHVICPSSRCPLSACFLVQEDELPFVTWAVLFFFSLTVTPACTVVWIPADFVCSCGCFCWGAVPFATMCRCGIFLQNSVDVARHLLKSAAFFIRHSCPSLWLKGYDHFFSLCFFDDLFFSFQFICFPFFSIFFLFFFHCFTKIWIYLVFLFLLLSSISLFSFF